MDNACGQEEMLSASGSCSGGQPVPDLIGSVRRTNAVKRRSQMSTTSRISETASISEQEQDEFTTDKSEDKSVVILNLEKHNSDTNHLNIGQTRNDGDSCLNQAIEEHHAPPGSFGRQYESDRNNFWAQSRTAQLGGEGLQRSNGDVTKSASHLEDVVGDEKMIVLPTSETALEVDQLLRKQVLEPGSAVEPGSPIYLSVLRESRPRSDRSSRNAWTGVYSVEHDERGSSVGSNFSEDASQTDSFIEGASDGDEWEVYENLPDSVAEAEEIERKRTHVAAELLDTELSYLQKLQFLNKMKSQLLSMNSTKHLIPKDELDKMFPHIEELCQLHGNNIIPALQTVVANWGPESNLSRVFIHQLSKLQLYSRYINAYPLAIKTIETWRKEESKFCTLLQIFQQHSVFQLDLLDLMHEPYIRLQKLKLLLLRYVKCLVIHTRENTDMQAVLDFIDHILKNCEDILQQADNLDLLLKLEDRIDGVTVLLKPDTTLLKEGLVTQVDPRGKNFEIILKKKLESTLYLFLFNHFLLVCTPKYEKRKHTICKKVKLPEIKLLSGEMLSSMGYDGGRCFVLQTPRSTMHLSFTSSEDMTQWKDAISRACCEARTRQSFKASNASCADFTCSPAWIPDDSVKYCMHCQHAFTLILRRHHCRGCGIVVCASCWRHRIMLPYSGNEIGNVCETCFKRARKLYPGLLADQDDSKTSTKSLKWTDTDGTFGQSQHEETT